MNNYYLHDKISMKFRRMFGIINKNKEIKAKYCKLSHEYGIKEIEDNKDINSFLITLFYWGNHIEIPFNYAEEKHTLDDIEEIIVNALKKEYLKELEEYVFRHRKIEIELENLKYKREAIVSLRQRYLEKVSVLPNITDDIFGDKE